MTSIGDNAFKYCASLTTITIPENSQLASIGNLAFHWCGSLTAINIPKSVTSIKSDAFCCCSSLTTITVANENATYDSRGGCNAIIETNSNTLIAGCATTIIPKDVTSIGNYAFHLRENLTKINIPESVTSVGDYAFASCTGLTAITIPASVTSIGEGAFYECSSLTAINIPEGVTSIGDYAFCECSSLTAITCETATPPTIGRSDTFHNVDKSIPVYVPAGSVESYKAAKYWSEFTNIIVLGKCATPTISYMDGEFVLTCDTEGAEIRTTVTSENDNEYVGTRFEFIPTHSFTAYASKDKYEDSDPVALTLCWVPCTEEHESEEDGILTIPSKPVLISTQGGTITVSGLAAGTAVAAYSTASTQLATATATDGTATLTTGLEAGSIAIVKIGNYSVKVAIK